MHQMLIRERKELCIPRSVNSRSSGVLASFVDDSSLSNENDITTVVFLFKFTNDLGLSPNERKLKKKSQTS